MACCKCWCADAGAVLFHSGMRSGTFFSSLTLRGEVSFNQAGMAFLINSWCLLLVFKASAVRPGSNGIGAMMGMFFIRLLNVEISD